MTYYKIHHNFFKLLPDKTILAHGKSDSVYGLGSWMNLNEEEQDKLREKINSEETTPLKKFPRTSNESRP